MITPSELTIQAQHNTYRSGGRVAAYLAGMLASPAAGIIAFETLDNYTAGYIIVAASGAAASACALQVRCAWGEFCQNLYDLVDNVNKDIARTYPAPNDVEQR